MIRKSQLLVRSGRVAIPALLLGFLLGTAFPLRADVLEVYQVQAGDTLLAIANRYSTTTEVIRARNGMSPDDLIYIGQTLTIPVGVRSLPSTNNGAGSQTPNASSPTSSPRTTRILGRLATVTGRGARIRSQRSASARIYFAPRSGMQVIATEHVSGWWGVYMSNGAIGWIPERYLRVSSVDLVGTNPIAGGDDGVIRVALQYLGVPYRYGGSTSRGIDCSALIQRAFQVSRGITLPRTAAEQARVGMEVPPDQLRAGDRIYFSRSGTRIDHCGIYLGNGQFVHASGSSQNVTISGLYGTKYSSWYRIARR